ncbi:hypothetical protein Tco_0617527, partial [Tanacetum coccineum]
MTEAMSLTMLRRMVVSIRRSSTVKLRSSSQALRMFIKQSHDEGHLIKLEDEYETITSGSQFKLNTTIFTGYTTNPTSLLEAIQSLGYPKETMGYYFYFPPENKVIVARYGDFLERDLISQEFSGRDYHLEDDHMDTLPSENTSVIPVEPKSLGHPPELIPVRRSERTTRAPNRLCLNMEVEDDVVGDLGEPANYKAFMLDPDK